MISTKPIYNVRHITDLRDLLNQSYQNFKTNNAFIIKKNNEERHHPISYAQLKSNVDCLGTSLIRNNLKGKKIAILSENRYEWAVSYFSVVNGTGIVVPIDRALPLNEIENIIQMSEIHAIIYSGNFQEHMNEIHQKFENIELFIGMDLEESHSKFLSFDELVNQGSKLLNEGDKNFIDAPIDNTAMSVLLFTSGTSGVPKAVMLSHKNICTNIMDIRSTVNVKNDDVLLSFLPLHHMYECTCGFLTAIYSGACITYCEGLKHIVKNLQEFKATIMCSVPLIFENMYKRIWQQAAKKRGLVTKMKIGVGLSNTLRTLFRIDLTNKLFKQIKDTLGGRMRLFICGASAIDPKAAKGFRDFGIRFLQGYGLTECSPLVTGNNDLHCKDDSGGIPLPSVQVKISSPDGKGIGEIVTKGDNVMIGYYNNQEATDNVLKDGWFYTGDLGFMDKDGFLHITSRKKNVIVLKNGKNVYPEEIEEMINRCPYIKESLVWDKMDKNGKNILCATLVINKEEIQLRFPEIDLTDDKIHSIIEKEIKKVNKLMPAYKAIREFITREKEFVKTTTQKIKRYMEKIH